MNRKPTTFLSAHKADCMVHLTRRQHSHFAAHSQFSIFIFLSAQVAFFRWEDVPWDSLAFPTTSWALWHHHQRSESFRYEFLRSESVGSESPRSEHKSEPLQAELAGSPGEDVAGGTEQETGRRDNLRSDSGLGDGARSGSSRAVFSAPTTISAQFWCPKRGLHIKDDWNISADS